MPPPAWQGLSPCFFRGKSHAPIYHQHRSSFWARVFAISRAAPPRAPQKTHYVARAGSVMFHTEKIETFRFEPRETARRQDAQQPHGAGGARRTTERLRDREMVARPRRHGRRDLAQAIVALSFDQRFDG